MATYLKDGVGQFPQEQGFTPNYNFIMRTLDMRQSQYDQGFSQVKSIYNSILNSEMLRDDNKERRDEIIANAKKSLQDLPTVDLSINKNVASAKSVFEPFYSDEGILKDITYTKQSKANAASGASLQNSQKEEDRNRYWGVGVQDIYDGMDEFKNASADEALNMNARRYVAKPQIGEKILKMFNEGKLKRTVDELSGMIKYTDENGEQIHVPLMNMYKSLAENDAETMEGFNVYGRVSRTSYIRNNTANGMYASKEIAAQAHDKALVTDYLKIQKKGSDQTTASLVKINTIIDGYQQKLGNNTLTEQDAADMAKAELVRDQLKSQGNEYTDNLNNGEQKIMSNPSLYLGQLYLNKQANDLAESLGGFGSRKIESNPLEKDFNQPFKLAEFKSQKDIELEKVKAQLEKENIKYKAEMNALYGDGDGDGGDGGSGTSGSTGKVTLKDLNVGIVGESIAGSGVAGRDASGVADAYQQNVELKRNIVNKITNDKIYFIENALDAEELVDKKGNRLTFNQIRELSKDPATMDALYNKATDKLATMNATLNPDNQDKATALGDTKLRIDNQYKSWQAADKFMGGKLKNIIANLEATETSPAKTTTVKNTGMTPEMRALIAQGQGYGNVGADVAANTGETTYTAPAKNEGWIYKHLTVDNKGETLLGEEDAEKFYQNVKKDPEFEKRVAQQWANDVKGNLGAKRGLLNPLHPFQGYRNVPTVEESRYKVMNQIKDEYAGYRNKVKSVWNLDLKDNSFMTQNDPLKGGGGTTSKTLSFETSSSVKGEIGGAIAEDLMTKIKTIKGSDDFMVKKGPDVPAEGNTFSKGSKPENNEDLQELLQDGLLSREIITSVKNGKDAALKNFTITSSMVGGGNPNYNSYTIHFDPAFIKSMQGGESGQEIIPNAAKLLKNGITIYLKKDVDNTLASTKSTMGEIDMLVNTDPNKELNYEVVKDHNLNIRRLTTGEYKIKYTYLEPELDKDNKFTGKMKATPTTKEISMPPNADLSTFYYNTVADLKRTAIASKVLQNNFTAIQAKATVNPKVITRADIDNLKAQLLNQ